MSKNLPPIETGEEQAARMVGVVAGFHLAEERRALWR